MSALPPLPLAAASSSSQSRPALYRDALTSVLAFLKLRELAAALSVSKEWRAAVSSMRPAMLTADSSFEPLDALLSSSSPLRRHVGQLGQQGHDVCWLRANQLAALCHAVPELQSLSAQLELVPVEAPLLFPPRLQRLSMLLVSWRNEVDETAAALPAAIGQLQQLHTLRLRMRFGQVSLAPLKQLSQLHDFELHVPFPLRVEQFAAEVRALHWLYRLHIDVPYAIDQAPRASLFTALLHDAPEERIGAMQWRDFVISHLMFTDELTPLLLRLPSLERLEGDLSSCTRFKFLTALPRLTHLGAHLWDMQADAWRNLLGVFTSDGLAHLCTLHLRLAPCSSDDLALLLSHTPTLTSLVLYNLSHVSSLSFFIQLPKLAATLAHLTVKCWYPWRLTAADLPPLLALQQLRELRLLEWPNQEPHIVTAADLAPFQQRPCVVLPHLEVFEWTTC